jgi:preprotein translocase subunit SecD
MILKTRIIAVFILILAVLIGFYDYSSKPFKLGLDLNGGTHLVYSEPIVQIEHGNFFSSEGAQEKLIVELPGVTDIDEAVKSIGETPFLDFRVLTKEDQKAIEDLKLEDPEQQIAEVTRRLKDTGLTGRMLEKAQLVFNQNTNEPIVSLVFTSEGRDLFAKITKENIGNVLGIFLDSNPISMPVVQDEIRDGKAQISGSFDVKTAQELVRNLNYGALPVPIELISTQTIGASLGQSAVNGGVRAGVVSFIVIGIFLVIWYRLPGLIAVVSLGIYTVIMLALFKLIPVTLTGAGIAAFILSIGMAVDANILIFERMKEELKKGKGIWDAMHEGFARAWLSIRDSNISSILTGAILYYFGSTSVVTGFALVFVIGVLVSMFTAITASRIFLYAVAPKNTNRISTFLVSNGFTKTKINQN